MPASVFLIYQYRLHLPDALRDLELTERHLDEVLPNESAQWQVGWYTANDDESNLLKPRFSGISAISV
jgi:hypothetical protein